MYVARRRLEDKEGKAWPEQVSLGGAGQESEGLS